MISYCGTILSFVFCSKRLCAWVIKIYNLSGQPSPVWGSNGERQQMTHPQSLHPASWTRKQTHRVNKLRCKTQQPDTISSLIVSHTHVHSLNFHFPPANDPTVYLRICPSPSCPSTCRSRQRRHCVREEPANELWLQASCWRWCRWTPEGSRDWPTRAAGPP